MLLNLINFKIMNGEKLYNKNEMNRGINKK